MNKPILPEFPKFLKSQIATVIGGFILIFLIVNFCALILNQITNTSFSNLGSIILQQILLILLIIILIKHFSLKSVQNKPRKVTTIVYNIVLTFIYFILISFVIQSLKIPGFGIQENILNLFPDSGVGLYITILVFTIVAPITEEIIFRGYLLGGLLKKFTKSQSITISSIIFSLIHFQPDVIFPLFILSVLISHLYLKTNSIKVAIYFHILNNSLKTYLLLYLI